MHDNRTRVAHVISPVFCNAIFTVHIHFCHFLWLCVSQVEPGQGILTTYYDSYSVPFLSHAHFSPPSSIKRLRESLAPRSSCPLASTAQFFEVMPGWSKQAAPLAGEPPLLLPPIPGQGQADGPLTSVHTILFYSLVLHSSRSASGRHRPFGLIAYTCLLLFASAGTDKTEGGGRGGSSLAKFSPHLELIERRPESRSHAGLCQWGFNL